MAKLWQTLNSRKVQQVFEPFGRGWHKIDFSFILYGLATSSAFRTLCLKKRAKIFEKLYLLRFSNKSMSWIFLGSGLHSPSWKRYSLGVPTLVDDCQMCHLQGWGRESCRKDHQKNRYWSFLSSRRVLSEYYYRYWVVLGSGTAVMPRQAALNMRGL